MPGPRPFALVQTADQWRRASFERTALNDGVVQLAWTTDAGKYDPSLPLHEPEGLAFDSHCRLFYTERAKGRVGKLLWAAAPGTADAVDVIDEEGNAAAPLGDFAPRPVPSASPSFEPCAVAVDSDDRLYVADAAARAVSVIDLWSGRLLRTVPLPGRPVDLAIGGAGQVLVLVAGPAAALISLEGPIGRTELPLPAGAAHPFRLAVSSFAGLAVLDRDPATGVRLLVAGRDPIAVAEATDLDFQAPDLLVIARRPGEDFLRVRFSATDIDRATPLKAKGYDGRGIVATPDGRIAFLTAKGVRHAVGARLEFERTGRVTTFQLDSGVYQTTWGRVFLDACIPAETDIHIHCVAVDEPPLEATLVRQPPANGISAVVVRPDLSPPMPPLSLVPAAGGVAQRLHSRTTGPELPWIERPETDRFETYEAPALTGAGRFLWVTIELSGNGAFTPFARSLRVEQIPHQYVNLLPKIYSREDEASGFLQRYLAMFDETVAELDSRSAARHALIDPRSAPPALLAWLASFVGLVTDERWPDPVKRQLIEEAIWLFRFRGTVPGLKRFLEIYLGREVIVIEKYQTRGLGGALLGGGDALTANSILGAGFRVGGAVANAADQFIEGNAADAFETHAHRFTVLIPAMLTAEELDVVRHILEVHRPAHTLVDVCTIGAGMRVGRGLHVGMSSMIGATAAFSQLRAGGSYLGRGAVVGRPAAGFGLTGTRVGRDSRVG